MEPSNEHPWKVWIQLAQRFRRSLKYENCTDDVDNSSYDHLDQLTNRQKETKILLCLVSQYCPHAIPSYYVFLNGTTLNCINIKYEKQKNF